MTASQKLIHDASVARPIAPADREHVLAANNASAVETSLLDAAALDTLLRMAFRSTCAGEPELGAFLIALDQNAPYDNPNFAWFKARHARFVYVDRIVTAKAHRGRGFARALYLDLFDAARSAGHGVVGCEVNIDPPNPASDAFHAALGFREVGRAALTSRGKVVRYLERDL